MQKLLTAIVGRILQTSDRKASVAMGAATQAMAGTAFAGAVTGAIGSLGTAGTGAAIAGLSGAAKTSATLYWIGGLVGGGVAAGTAILGIGVIGAGVYGSIKVRRAILGHARRESELSDQELTILEAANALISAIGGGARREGQGRPGGARALLARGHLPVPGGDRPRPVTQPFR